ncbi:hypothetical protein JW868_00140 [Candidatus Woesearchaeota archaeon]|nr:hypothetical protein [Candidatus Woesearchaeota archaeon]
MERFYWFGGILFLILSSLASAATIEGIVYDFDLARIDNAVVTVNSTPVQTMVAEDGRYSFQVALGQYLINASSNGRSESQDIEISSEGVFRLDLIFFDEVVNEEELVEDVEVVEFEGDEEVKQSRFSLLMTVMMIVWLGIIAFLIFLSRINKKSKKVLDALEDDNEKLLLVQYLKKHRRVTQKQIRSNMPFSESKVSMIISELENEGRVRKIKKGRANIVVLVKKKKS